jgi:hypothetical protein
MTTENEILFIRISVGGENNVPPIRRFGDLVVNMTEGGVQGWKDRDPKMLDSVAKQVSVIFLKQMADSAQEDLRSGDMRVLFRGLEKMSFMNGVIDGSNKLVFRVSALNPTGLVSERMLAGFGSMAEGEHVVYVEDKDGGSTPRTWESEAHRTATAAFDAGLADVMLRFKVASKGVEGLSFEDLEASKPDVSHLFSAQGPAD